MTVVFWLTRLLVGGLLLWPVQGQAPVDPEVARLVQQLGDSQFTQREAAFQELKQRGPSVLPTLRRALASTDPEIRRRAEELVPILERRAESDRALAPTTVTLAYQATPLGEVLQDLTRQTKYRFQLSEKDKTLAARPVTLSGKDLPLWHALDQINRQAKVHCELGGGQEVLEEKWGPAKGRARQYGNTYRGVARDNVFVCTDSTGQAPPAEGCTVGAVRCVLRSTVPAPEAASRIPAGGLGAAPGRDQAQLKPQAPGAPVPPQPARGMGPAQAAGRAGQAVPPPPRMPEAGPRDARRQLAKEKDATDNRPLRTLILEVFTEPKLQWRGPLQARTEPLLDDKRQEIDFMGGLPTNRKNDPNNEPIQVLAVGPNGRQVIIQGQEVLNSDPLGRLTGKQEIALQYRLPENPGKVLPVLKGCLVGQVQTPLEPVVEVPDIAKAGKEIFKGKDDLQLHIVEMTTTRPRQYRLVFELTNPAIPANPWVGNAQVQMRVQVNNRMQQQIGGRGNLDGFVSAPDFTVYDDKGRVMTVTGRTDTQVAGKATWGQRMTLILEAADDQAKPVRLVHSATRLVTIEVPFEFKNVRLQ